MASLTREVCRKYGRVNVNLDCPRAVTGLDSNAWYMTLVEGSQETFRYLTEAFWNWLYSHNGKWRDMVGSTVSQFSHIGAPPMTSHGQAVGKCSPAVLQPNLQKGNSGSWKAKEYEDRWLASFFRRWFPPLFFSLFCPLKHFTTLFSTLTALSIPKQRENDSTPLSCDRGITYKKFGVFSGCTPLRGDSHNSSTFFSRKVPIPELVHSASCAVPCSWRNPSQQLLTLCCVHLVAYGYH